VRSSGYWYQVRRADGPEVLAFHWHPAGPGANIPFPHLHLGRALGAIDIDPKAHVPTGRVSLEAVVAFLIRELGVRPLRPDWESVLAANQAAFDTTRTW
jgi:hypothetical protein